MNGQRCLMFLVCFLVVILPLQCQIVSGTIVGTVTDASGAAIASAKVTVVNEDTNSSRETVSKEAGNFSFSNLTPGRYKVTASHAGFKSAVVANIELLIAQTARADVKLEVGQMTEQVTVQGVAVLLETDTPTIGQVIEQKPIQDLPLNGRNFMQLADAIGGRDSGHGPDEPPTRRAWVAHPDHDARGRRARQLQQLPHRRHGESRLALRRDSDSAVARRGEGVQDPAQFLLRRVRRERGHHQPDHQIRNEPDSRIGVRIPAQLGVRRAAVFRRRGPSPFRLNQYGVSVGGPIKRDKTFFFGNWEGRRQRRARRASPRCRAAEPQRQFFRLATAITDPFNNNAPFPGNVIPQNRISKFSQRQYNQFIPAPNAEPATRELRRSAVTTGMISTSSISAWTTVFPIPTACSPAIRNRIGTISSQGCCRIAATNIR